MTSLKCGLVGLPNVGKSTLFNALTKAGIAAENYPFCTIEPNHGIAHYLDARVTKLAELSQSEKTTYASIEFVDVAGLVRGAHKNEGLGNSFLSNLRQSHAIVQVVRCFHDSDILHVDGKVDPLADIETINLELAMADLDSVDRHLAATVSRSKSGDKEIIAKAELLAKAKTHLEQNQPLRTLQLEGIQELADEYNLLTHTPMLYLANVNDEPSEVDSASVEAVAARAESDGAGFMSASLALEAELAVMEPEDMHEMMRELGLQETQLTALVGAMANLLNLIYFFTAGPTETRAWPIVSGALAPEAAGKIHTDMQRGFICAEIVSYDEYIEAKEYKIAKEQGIVRTEGRNYQMQDGDVTLFRFNV